MDIRPIESPLEVATLAECRKQLHQAFQEIERVAERAVQAERGEKIALIAAEVLLRRHEDAEALARDMFGALGVRWGDNPFPRIRELVGALLLTARPIDRQAILTVAQDVGTVIAVAIRRSDPDPDTRQMITRLREWRHTLLDAVTPAELSNSLDGAGTELQKGDAR
jgi:hypothetical protein